MAGRVAVLVASVVGTTPGTYSGRNMLETEDQEDIGLVGARQRVGE